MRTIDAVFQWYQQADTKAQTILGFTGIFLGIIAAPLLAGAKASGSLTAFDVSMLLLTIITASAGIVLSVAALWSRGMFGLGPAGIHFFGHIAAFTEAPRLLEAIATMSFTEHLQGLSTEILILSKNTKRKHRLVDAAAVSAGAALLSIVVLIFSVLLE